MMTWNCLCRYIYSSFWKAYVFSRAIKHVHHNKKKTNKNVSFHLYIHKDVFVSVRILIVSVQAHIMDTCNDEELLHIKHEGFYFALTIAMWDDCKWDWWIWRDTHDRAISATVITKTWGVWRESNAVEGFEGESRNKGGWEMELRC